MKKQQYYILSGEGSIGQWRAVRATDRGVKRILTRERCGGVRWARAYRPMQLSHGYECHDDAVCDIETGEPRTLPSSIK